MQAAEAECVLGRMSGTGGLRAEGRDWEVSRESVPDLIMMRNVMIHAAIE